MSGVMLRSGAADAPLQSEYGTEDVEEVDGLAADGAAVVFLVVYSWEILSRTHIAHTRDSPLVRGGCISAKH